jgi:hypothetical protein
MKLNLFLTSLVCMLVNISVSKVFSVVHAMEQNQVILRLHLTKSNKAHMIMYFKKTRCSQEPAELNNA